jgi:hypothetical protein
MIEKLRQKYEDVAWEEAIGIVEAFIEEGEINEAKKQAREAILNWQKEDKTEIINKFKDWLKDKNINLDED